MIEYIDDEKCNYCGKCVEVCPMDVFETLGDRLYLARRTDCMTCFLCEIACPPDAIYVDPHRNRKVVYPWPM